MVGDNGDGAQWGVMGWHDGGWETLERMGKWWEDNTGEIMVGDIGTGCGESMGSRALAFAPTQ